MKANIGTFDRALRIAVGLILIGLSLSGVIGWWGLIGLVPLATGLFRSCPAYSLLGINTCTTKR
tara:strand:+ start:1206 stop:1397 length:192 start_codon:yes stop_codon:yes gene_type:complete